MVTDALLKILSIFESDESNLDHPEVPKSIFNGFDAILGTGM
jgi:hypothetical protein